ncbi:hypothetical protein B484DRAFT_444222 [Ochromonadaceae sp. CCMP2298]|nr:hypothetical protein B484DRAFT_444222 [Ochromonadaceae sp. CCMP2298]
MTSSLSRQRCVALALTFSLLCLPSVHCFFGLKAAIPKVALDTPFLILPGFGNDEIDYVDPLQQGFEKGLQYCLQEKGVQSVSVLSIKRGAWLNIAKGVLKPSFWKSECKPYDLFDFYMDEVDRTVRRIREQTGKPVVLVGHSAGGWLARAVLADGTWMAGNKRADGTRSSDFVAGLVTLGAPHFPPREGFADMTRGCLKFVDKSFPGAYLTSKPKGAEKSQSVFYITVGGTAVTGDALAEKRSAAKFAADSYVQVTGNLENGGSEAGDGVVPISNAHLSGAQQITLDGVWHSIQAPGNNWYGKPENIDLWLPQTLKLIAARKQTASRV